MNPYAKILSLLEALPDEERLLVSGVRRKRVDGRDCGCLFGTLLPKQGFPALDSYSGSYFVSLTLDKLAPIRTWGRDVFNLSDVDLYRFVAELERVNDHYEVNNNSVSLCRARYKYVCDYLRTRQTTYAQTGQIKEGA